MRFTAKVKTLAISGVAAASVLGMATAANAQDGDILIGEGAFPESIAALPNGGFITGSVVSPNLYAWAPGDESASVWATTDGVTLGVFATEDTVYACVGDPGFSGNGRLVTFDLASAEQSGVYPLPSAGLCNDIAVSPDGTAFVTDTGGFAGMPGAVFALVPVDEEGNLGLQTVVASSAIGGADGLAFLGDRLIVNDVMTGALFAIDLDGATMTDFEFLDVSRALEGPDGMRTAVDGSGIYVAENAAGRVSFITIDGDSATVETVGEGDWMSATSVAEFNDGIYVIDTMFGMMGGDEVPTFYAHRVEGGM